MFNKPQKGNGSGPAFPWWEESRTPGVWGRIKTFRPGLLLALLLGVMVFVVEFEAPTPRAEQDPLPAATEQRDAASLEDASAAAGPPVPTASLLGDLFGSDAVDPLFRIPDVVVGGEESPDEQTDTPETSESVPEEEPQRSIWLYLVAASDIGFENNESRLGLALATAEQGETDAMNRLIADLEQKLLEYAALVPPEELRETHETSIRVVERYINHLRASRDKAEGSVEDTWHSAERDAIAEEASRINQQIRDIVHSTGTVLPPGVLP